MKKVLYLMYCILAMTVTMPIMTSCEPEDDEEYYAGESEEDYKPNTYSIIFNWDFSGVSDLSSSEKQRIKTELDKMSVSSVFNTKKEAIVAFDKAVNDAKYDKEMASFKGLKCTMKLTRGTAVIKKATLSW